MRRTVLVTLAVVCFAVYVATLLWAENASKPKGTVCNHTLLTCVRVHFTVQGTSVAADCSQFDNYGQYCVVARWNTQRPGVMQCYTVSARMDGQRLRMARTREVMSFYCNDIEIG